MHTCMHSYMYILYIHIYTFIYVLIYIYPYTFIYTYSYIYIYIYVCMYVQNINICTYICICLWLCLCSYLEYMNVDSENNKIISTGNTSRTFFLSHFFSVFHISLFTYRPFSFLFFFFHHTFFTIITPLQIFPFSFIIRKVNKQTNKQNKYQIY